MDSKISLSNTDSKSSSNNCTNCQHRSSNGGISPNNHHDNNNRFTNDMDKHYVHRTSSSVSSCAIDEREHEEDKLVKLETGNGHSIKITTNSRSNDNNNNSSSNSLIHQYFSRIIRQFEDLGREFQLSILTIGLFLFFGLHNVLQEAIMKQPGFEFGVMLGYFEVLGVTICSYVERNYFSNEGMRRVAPLSAYPLLALCLLSSSSLSNMSLNYINFPTKVVFRSCKLIPTMMIASIVHKKIFTSIEYVCAVSICLGLIFFAAADWSLTPTFNPLGITFVSLSVCADALLPNAQERLFQMGSSRLEVTLYTNIYTLLVMTVTTYLSGDFVGCFYATNKNANLIYLIALYTFNAYIAISFHMNIVKRFGGVTAVLIATARKGLTLVLSFLLFPKAFSWMYVAGAVLVLGGLMVSSLLKTKKKQHIPSSEGINK